MIKRNTLLHVAYTVGVYLVLSGTAAAQSVLNFARTTVNERISAGIAVTNPSTNYADVQFTFWGNEGNPLSSGLVNPVRYRLPPKGQISLMASELFASSNMDGWVQATSSTSGLIGSYLSGNFTSTLEGAEASPALSAQLVPVVRQDQINRTDLIVINPGATNGNAVVTFFNPRGEEVGTITRNITSHAAAKLSAPNGVPGNLSVRISSSVPMSATAVIHRDDSLLFAPGQPVDQIASVRVVPHFVSDSGLDPVLVLVNPNASAVPVTITALSETGGPAWSGISAPIPVQFVIPANGSISANARAVAGTLLVAPPMNGWLRIESPNVSLAGMMILDQGNSVTAVPLQSNPISRTLFPQLLETDSAFTGLALVNPFDVPASVDVAVVRGDGTTSAQRTLTIDPNSKLLAILRDIVPEAYRHNQGYILIRSSVAVFGVEMVGSANGDEFLASIPPSRVSDRVIASPIIPRPIISQLEPESAVRPGDSLRIWAPNVVGEVAVLLGDQVVPSRLLTPFGGVFVIDVPALEPGFVSVRIKNNGLESAPFPLQILLSNNQPSQTLSGQAFYQKVDVRDAGLDLNNPVMVPIRNARVEVIDRFTQTLVAVSETDTLGKFRIPVPATAGLTIRVLSRLRYGGLRVADNTNLNALYSISADIDGRDSLRNVLIADTSRVSGAFNILEMIQLGNDVIRMADPGIVPPQITIYWSPRNVSSRDGTIAQGFVGTTYFNIASNTAFVVGDRSDDSDEFDDSVILHEYAHMLAARFSRDDSPGGRHSLGDILDPRLAWSEAWANFFSGAVRNDAIYRDSRVDGLTLRYDLEDNIPVGDRPGYWSEASVGTLLWDLYDDRVDAADSVQYPFSLIWAAFTDLRNERFVYVPYYLEHFLARNPSSTETLRIMVQFRSIDFQPNVRPSVPNPFPRIIDVGQAISGNNVDSLTSKRINLMQSSHFWMFTTAGGNASMRLDVTGLGPAENQNANDLDLFLLDANGGVLTRSDAGLNGQSELISVRLPAGVYFLEVRSFYTKAETGELVFNSGQYRLSVLVQ
ncbi:MAG: PPC domain-containing protein [Acidobacteria bacterium]|nr:PPC domain-containing protein [Acidobacteriota bacterium]